MNKKIKKFLEEVNEEENLSVTSLDEVRSELLNNEDSGVRSGISFAIAAHKIIGFEHDLILLLCNPKSANNSSTLVYASRQFECSRYFNIYIALIIDNYYFITCLECYRAIRKSKNIPISDLDNAIVALGAWYHFHSFPEYTDSEIISKRKLINEIIWYLKDRIYREKRKSSLARRVP